MSTTLDLINVAPFHLHIYCAAAFFGPALKHWVDLPLQLMAHIYRSLSKPLRSTPEAWLLFLGTGRVVERDVWRDSAAQEAQTQRCSLWGWWLTENQPERGRSRTQTPPWLWLVQRVEDAVINSMNPSCPLLNLSHSTVQLSLSMGTDLDLW